MSNWSPLGHTVLYRRPRFHVVGCQNMIWRVHPSLLQLLLTLQ